MAVLIAGETQPLNGLAVEECLSIAEAAELYLIRADMLGKVAGRYTGRSGLQHQDTHTLLGELLGYPATTGSGADNHRVRELFADTHRRMRMLSLPGNLGTGEGGGLQGWNQYRYRRRLLERGRHDKPDPASLGLAPSERASF